MFFKKKRKVAVAKADKVPESEKSCDDFEVKESLEKRTLSGLSDEEIAKAIRTVLRKSKLN